MADPPQDQPEAATTLDPTRERLVETLSLPSTGPDWPRAAAVFALLPVGAAAVAVVAWWTSPAWFPAVPIALAEVALVSAMLAWFVVLKPSRQHAAHLRTIMSRVDRLAGSEREESFDVLLAIDQRHPLRPLCETIHGSLTTAHADRLAAARLKREMRSRVERETKRQTAHLETLSHTDELTRLANRRGFEARLERLVAQCRRDRVELALLAIDLDHFKLLNDTCGHTKGDEALAVAGEILIAHTRHHDLAGRLGGDELMLALAGVAPEEAVVIAERLIRMFNTHPAGAAEDVPWPSMSIGVSFLRADGAQTPAELCRFADEALYASKRGGRAQVRQFRNVA